MFVYIYENSDISNCMCVEAHQLCAGFFLCVCSVGSAKGEHIISDDKRAETGE